MDINVRNCAKTLANSHFSTTSHQTEWNGLDINRLITSSVVSFNAKLVCTNYLPWLLHCAPAPPYLYSEWWRYTAAAATAAAGFQKEWNRKFLVFASERSGVQLQWPSSSNNSHHTCWRCFALLRIESIPWRRRMLKAPLKQPSLWIFYLLFRPLLNIA